MPLTHRVPSYRKHRASGQAVVTLNGKDHYLGPFGTAVSKRQYDMLIAQWTAGGRRIQEAPQDMTVGEIVLLYIKHAAEYYRRADGSPTGVHDRVIRELGPLIKLYKTAPAAEFGPLKLKSVRNWMIELGWVRTSINHATSTIRRCFKWAAANELIAATIFESLRTVEGLKAGRSRAKEAKRVQAVSFDIVDMTLWFLPPLLSSAVRLQLITGMRSGELLTLRTGDIDRSGSVWCYEPRSHKTQHHGIERRVFIGPKGQAILNPLLPDDPDEFVFSPRASEQQRRAMRHSKRKTPLNQGNRPGTNCKQSPQRALRSHYGVDSYRRSITRAADQADRFFKGGKICADDERIVPRWHPHQLRHAAATRIRETSGLEAAQLILGHSSLRLTEHYAQINAAKAIEVMARVG